MAFCGGCKLFTLSVRALCGPPRSGLAVTQPVCQIRTVVTSTRTCSLEPFTSPQRKTPSTPGKGERISPSSTHAQRNFALSVKEHRRPHRRYDVVDLGDVEDNTQKAMKCAGRRRFIVDPELAKLVSSHLSADIEDEKAVIFDANPGPGVLTKVLLNCGAQRVVALESDRIFLPELHALEARLDGQLEVVHCDFFKLDPVLSRLIPPAITSEKLFTDLGISGVPWTEDVPVKVVGIIPQATERNRIWRLVHTLFERASIYHYGRIELIMFMSEKEYLKMIAKPGDYKRYRSMAALSQIGFDIQLLHKEPWKSFVTSTRHIQKSTLPNDHMCLVRLTPRKDLFTSCLTPNNGNALVMLVKQCLAKRKMQLIEKLESWGPGSGSRLICQMGLFDDIQTGDMYPEEFKKLFELIEKSQEFKHNSLYTEIVMNANIQNFTMY